MECRRNHVRGQRRAQPVPQDVDLDRPLAAVEGHQLLALVGPFGHHHRPVADPRDAQQRVLDLADLDPEATDLDLGIPAAEELQLAVGQPATVVTAAVEPLARPVRVGHEGSPGALGIVDVPAADADAGEDDLAGGAEGHR